MKHRIQNFAWALALAGVMTVFSAPASAQQCTPTGGVTSVGVSLIDQPFAYEDLEPALSAGEIADLPALPGVDDEIVRREHAYISTALAAQIGIAPHDAGGTDTVNPDWDRPNPQIRVWIEDPATFSNFKERKNGSNVFRARSSSAVFTVVGVIDDTRSRIWVYGQEDDTDKDSGEYKLFAEDTASSTGVREPRVHAFTDADADGLLDDATARVFRRPMSRRETTPNGASTPTLEQFYCEPDANGKLEEFTVNRNDNRIALLVPHGGAIETKTSDQIAPFRGVLEAAPYNVPVNYWEVQGTWSDDQTSSRWHITSTSIHESSFPGLEAILPVTPFATGRPFRHALSFHGFSGSQNDVIVGGDAPLNTKCLIVTRIKDRLAAVTPTALDRRTIAFVLHDADGVHDIAGLNNRTVARRDLSGLSDDNIVNRLSADGGIQLEQSKAVRDSQTLREAVAQGAATALGEVFNNTAPADACDIYNITTN